MTREDLQLLKELEAEASSAPWQHCRFTNNGGDWESHEQIAAYVLRCLKTSPTLDYFAISCTKPDGDADVCHTGNGPTSKQNAALIAFLRNHAKELIHLAEISFNEPECGVSR